MNEVACRNATIEPDFFVSVPGMGISQCKKALNNAEADLHLEQILLTPDLAVDTGARHACLAHIVSLFQHFFLCLFCNTETSWLRACRCACGAATPERCIRNWSECQGFLCQSRDRGDDLDEVPAQPGGQNWPDRGSSVRDSCQGRRTPPSSQGMFTLPRS